VLLACGLGAFAAAMACDLADRQRTRRQSECAFWLLGLLPSALIRHLPPAA